MFFGLNDVAFLAAVSAPALDPDAAAYIAAVEAADTQALEPAVRAAINDFVVGCKADGIWNAIKASCILAGARTLNGALVPLVGAAPTNVGGLFVSGDYDRKTGLVGDGSTKYLDSNRNNNADPQNSEHAVLYISTLATTGFAGIASGLIGASEGGTRVNTSTGGIRINANPDTTYTLATGFTGGSRNNANSFSYRVSSSTTSVNVSSSPPTTGPIFLFARPPSPDAHSNARLAFYSIGEFLDLALLDARVTVLINAFAAAIA
jgi:hypothetical protein